MPRLPVDGNRVIEHRITLGGKERELLADLATSYRIDAISGNDSVVEVLGDGPKVLAALGTIGAILELMGITDLFDFDDDLKAKVLDIKDNLDRIVKEKRTVYGPGGRWAEYWQAAKETTEFVEDLI